MLDLVRLKGMASEKLELARASTLEQFELVSLQAMA